LYTAGIYYYQLPEIRSKIWDEREVSRAQLQSQWIVNGKKLTVNG
jgi:hypothetical protein